MRVERADATGLGVALVAHAALLWALGLPRDGETPPPPAMEVSFVDEAGLVSAAPTTEPAAASVAPELGAPEEAIAAAPQPVPAPPETTPPEPQRPIPQPVQRQPAPTPQLAQRNAAPAPQLRRAAPAPAPQPRQARQGTGRAQASRGSRLGADILKGIGDDPVSRNPRPSGPVYSAQARASVFAAIQQALVPCERQPLPAPEAREIVVRVRVTLNRDGSLASAVPRAINSDPQLRIYEQRMEDLAVAVLRRCTPIRNLPAEFYDVRGGWRSFPYEFDPR